MSFTHVKTWLDIRKKTIRLLLRLAIELDNMQRNVDIAKLSGTSAAVAAGIGTIGCILAAPFTGGLSALGMLGFTGLGVAGGVVNFGTLIGKYFHEKDLMEKVQSALDDDRKESKKLNEANDTNANWCQKSEKLTKKDFDICEKICDLKTGAGTVTMYDTAAKIAASTKKVNPAPITYSARVASCSKSVSKSAQGVKTLKSCSSLKVSTGAHGANVARAVNGARASNGARAANGVRAANGAGAGVSRMFVVVTVVALPLDIYDLVQTSIRVHNGSINESAREVRRIANDLETEMNRIERSMREHMD